jgi:hypothetical protein
MRQIEYFVPGIADEDDGTLSRLRWPIPPGVARVYAEAYTDPGDEILIPYCQGAPVVRDVLAAERRPLALNFDPVMVLVAETAFHAPAARDMDAAVARLGDVLKQGVPLRRYLEDLYATTCPACLRPAVADHFVWDREQDAPVAKFLQCPACKWDGRTAVDEDDRARLAEIPARGMHYHYVLDRVGAQLPEDVKRARLEPLLQLYSPRNLYALAELTIRVESLIHEAGLRRALDVVLLDCLDHCSSMTPISTRPTRRRGLSRPGRFLERNVWYAFEEAVTRFQSSNRAPIRGLAETLEAYHDSPEEYVGLVGTGLVRDLSRVLPPRGVRLILTSPPPLNSAVWMLSYLWGAWLLGAIAVAPLRPLLRQRTPDPRWYARVMAGSFRNLAPLLRDDGHLVLILSDQRPALLEALLLAGSRARLGVAAVVQRGADYRLDLAPAIPQAAAHSPAALDEQIRQVTAQVAVEAIRSRGEPSGWRTLHAVILGSLAEKGLLVRALGAEGEGISPLDLVAEQVKAGLEDPRLVSLPASNGGDDLWWLANPSGTETPLCDRVERIAEQILRETNMVTEAEFVQAVYAQLPGVSTPEAELVAVCMRALSRETASGAWRLRPEDLPGARQAESQSIVEGLLSLGDRLGFETAHWPPFEAAWFEGKEVRAVFAVRRRAAVGETLALGKQLGGARPYMVIPGGRAALVSYKLAHNPLWKGVADEEGWRFIKYRHVRQLMAQPDVDQYALQTIVGLDPIVEKEQAQLALF